MQHPVKVVAVIAATPALSSVLSQVLSDAPTLRIRTFESDVALQTYMRLSPVDLLVCDFDHPTAPAGTLAEMLRHDERLTRRDFRIMALASTVTEQTKDQAIASGIDDVIVKPMSPQYLLERVRARLAQMTAHVAGSRYLGPERRNRLPRPAAALVATYAARGDNVVPLFRD